jgi:phosphoglycerate dehydrogenase-like enzyme
MYQRHVEVSTMLIAIFDGRVDASVAERLAGHEVRLFDNRAPSAVAFLEQAAGAQAIGARRIAGFEFDQALVEALPDLQFLHKTGTGTDWLDLPALTDHGILVATNDGFNAASVADHIVLLTQLCLRGTFEKLVEMRSGIWNREPPRQGVIGMGGKTVGIVGLGQIGTQAARRLAVAGAEIVAHGRHPREEHSIPGGVRWLPLDDLLRTADVVVLSVPLTAETEKLIGARELALMQQTAVLINCARGRVVDERALYEALAKHRIRAAGLDVFEQEPASADNPLLALDNVLATPHIAGQAADQVSGLLENLQLFAAGQRPRRLVNPEILDRGTVRATHLHTDRSTFDVDDPPR